MTRESYTAKNDQPRSQRLAVFVVQGSLLSLIIWQLTACSLKPGQGPTSGSDAVQPLWVDQSSGGASASVDTLRCANVVALLIGIGQYDPVNGWEALNSQNDVRLMETKLRQRGVWPAHIHRLTDQQATKKGIESALKTLADTLPRSSQLIILYAGHARQLPDDNGDEKDGYDEAIVPYDAPPVSRLQPDGYFRDDALNRYLTAIRSRLGPDGSLWLLFDSCHSETLDRGQTAQRTRGGVAPMGPRAQSYMPHKQMHRSGSDWYELPENSAELGPYILFSATTDSGESYETSDESGQSVGPLTRALCEVWDNKLSVETYRALFERMAVVMARYVPYQHPSLEGDVDRPTPGCATVPSTDAFGYRAIGEPVRINWPHQDAALTSLLTSLSFVKMAGAHPDLRIERRSRGYRLWIAANNQPLSEQVMLADACAEKIRQYFARTILMQLQQTSPDFQVKTTMQRVAVKTENGRTIVTDTLPNLTTTGLPTFQASARERVILTLTNTSQKPFYITLVDLQPDGSLHVLLPETGHSITEYQLTPGQSLRRRIRITEPFGAEVYKVLLTPEPIDLQGIVQTRGNYPVRHPYESIFQRTYTTRGTPEMSPIKLSNKAGATADVAFWVEKL